MQNCYFEFPITNIIKNLKLKLQTADDKNKEGKKGRKDEQEKEHSEDVQENE